MSSQTSLMDETEPFLAGNKLPLHNQVDESNIPVPERSKYFNILGNFCWCNEGVAIARCKYGFFPPFPTIIAFLLIVYDGWLGFSVCYPLIPPRYSWFKYISMISFFLSLISWFSTLLKDPGYLPYFYWQDPRKKYTLDELKEGTATTLEQIEYARSQKRLGRMCFSQMAGRYVLRPDHFCPWVGNFVGFYNYRNFMLTTFYLVIFTGTMIISLFMLWWYKMNPINVIMNFIYIFLNISFFCLSYTQFIIHVFLTNYNMTVLEYSRNKHQRSQKYDRGCFQNWEEVCGNRQYLLLWWLPIPIPQTAFDPFKYVVDQDNEVLSDNPISLQYPEFKFLAEEEEKNESIEKIDKDKKVTL